MAEEEFQLPEPKFGISDPNRQAFKRKEREILARKRLTKANFDCIRYCVIGILCIFVIVMGLIIGICYIKGANEIIEVHDTLTTRIVVYVGVMGICAVMVGVPILVIIYGVVLLFFTEAPYDSKELVKLKKRDTFWYAEMSDLWGMV